MGYALTTKHTSGRSFIRTATPGRSTGNPRPRAPSRRTYPRPRVYRVRPRGFPKLSPASSVSDVGRAVQRLNRIQKQVRGINAIHQLNTAINRMPPITPDALGGLASVDIGVGAAGLGLDFITKMLNAFRGQLLYNNFNITCGIAGGTMANTHTCFTVFSINPTIAPYFTKPPPPSTVVRGGSFLKFQKVFAPNRWDFDVIGQFTWPSGWSPGIDPDGRVFFPNYAPELAGIGSIAPWIDPATMMVPTQTYIPYLAPDPSVVRVRNPHRSPVEQSENGPIEEPSPQPKPDPQKDPWIIEEPVADPDAPSPPRPPIRPPDEEGEPSPKPKPKDKPRDKPPGKGKREKKWVVDEAMWNAMNTYGKATEALDLIDAVYKGLPGKLRRELRKDVYGGRLLTTHEKAMALYRHWREIDGKQAFYWVVRSQFEDTLIGQLHRPVDKLVQKGIKSYTGRYVFRFAAREASDYLRRPVQRFVQSKMRELLLR